MAVVRADTPQHRVVAVSETRSERDDEDVAADDPRLSSEHRTTSVADRLDPGRGANVVGEEDADAGRRHTQHGSVARDAPQEPGMGPGRLGEDQGTEQGEEEKGPNGQRFKKTSRARC